MRPEMMPVEPNESVIKAVLDIAKDGGSRAHMATLVRSPTSGPQKKPGPSPRKNAWRRARLYKSLRATYSPSFWNRSELSPVQVNDVVCLVFPHGPRPPIHKKPETLGEQIQPNDVIDTGFNHIGGILADTFVTS
jgi:hypothetical protein